MERRTFSKLNCGRVVNTPLTYNMLKILSVQYALLISLKMTTSEQQGTLATTRSPLVPLSRRCTIPGLITGGGPDRVVTVPTKASSSISSESSTDGDSSAFFGVEPLEYLIAGSSQWCRRAFTNVPSEWPGAGCTTCKFKRIHN